MGIEYLGLSSINGPLVILEGVQDDHRVDVVLGHIVLHAGEVVPGVEQVDLGDCLLYTSRCV